MREDRRGLAFYKEDGCDWTQEEYNNIMGYVGDEAYGAVIPHNKGCKYIYDDMESVNTGAGDNYHLWCPQDISECATISYESIFNKPKEKHVWILQYGFKDEPKKIFGEYSTKKKAKEAKKKHTQPDYLLFNYNNMDGLVVKIKKAVLS